MAAATPETSHLDWLDQLPCALTVCDRKYKILYMNEKAAEANSEGMALVGKSLMDCHPPSARRKLRHVMSAGKPHVFSIERKRVKRIVYQGHWKKNGKAGGLVEISFELPRDMPNLRRS